MEQQVAFFRNTVSIKSERVRDGVIAAYLAAQKIDA
jgi:hypothetical protein